MLQKIKRLWHHIVRRSSLSGLVGVVVMMIVFAMVLASVQTIQGNFQSQLKADEARQKVDVLDLEVQTQKLQNKYYTTTEFSELQSRRLLGKAMPGEHALVLPQSTLQAPVSSQKPAKAATVTQLKDRSNLEQWLYFLFSNKQQG